MKTYVYIIRHAQALGNEKGTFQGLTDCAISQKGEQQLVGLTDYFKDIPLDAIYSSSWQRAMATAQAVRGHRTIPITPVDDLHEINGGVWEGCRLKDIPLLYPKEDKAWHETPHTFCVENGEAMIDVYQRMKRAVDTIVKENVGKTIAVVSHGCALRNYCCYAMGLPFERLCDVPWLLHTGIGLVCYDERGNRNVCFLNDTSFSEKNHSTRIDFPLQNNNIPV